MSNKNINVSVSNLSDYYKVHIKLENKISNGMIVGIILGFLFFLIIGIILLIVWAVNSNKDSIDVSFNLKKDNWESELNKQLLLENFKENTSYIKNIIIEKIKLINDQK